MTIENSITWATALIMATVYSCHNRYFIAFLCYLMAFLILIFG